MSLPSSVKWNMNYPFKSTVGNILFYVHVYICWWTLMVIQYYGDCRICTRKVMTKWRRQLQKHGQTPELAKQPIPWWDIVEVKHDAVGLWSVFCQILLCFVTFCWGLGALLHESLWTFGLLCYRASFVIVMCRLTVTTMKSARAPRSGILLSQVYIT